MGIVANLLQYEMVSFSREEKEEVDLDELTSGGGEGGTHSSKFSMESRVISVNEGNAIVALLLSLPYSMLPRRVTEFIPRI